MNDKTEQWLAALEGAAAAQGLWAAATARLALGASESDLLDELAAVREQLRADQREADEDLVLELMDSLAGFVSPSMRISKSGRRVTDADLDRMAAEAERGYDLSTWRPRAPKSPDDK